MRILIYFTFFQIGDPVVIEEHWEDAPSGRPPQSVLKFLQDLFSQPETSKFFYTNDMKVLLDIITRNLTDLSSGEKVSEVFYQYGSF